MENNFHESIYKKSNIDTAIAILTYRIRCNSWNYLWRYQRKNHTNEKNIKNEKRKKAKKFNGGKNMRKETGMGHLTLILIVIVIVILVGLAVHLTKQQVTDNVIETAKTDMLLIQGKLKIIDESVKVNAEENSLKGTKVADLKEDEQVKKMLEEGILGEKAEEYYRLGREELDEMGLSTIQLKENQYYFVHYTTKDVATNIAIEDQEGKIYHHLSELVSEENTETNETNENAEEQNGEKEE